MRCNVTQCNRESLYLVCSHSSCWLWENMKEEAKTRMAKKKTLQRRKLNNMSQYYKAQNAYFHILLMYFQYETSRSTVTFKPWTIISYSDTRSCVCIYDSFCCTHLQSKNCMEREHNLPFPLTYIKITTNLGSLTGRRYIKWKWSKSGTFTLHPTKRNPPSICKVGKLYKRQ